MKTKDYFSQITTSLSEARQTAKAMSDYFSRGLDRINQKAEYIAKRLNNETAEINDELKYVNYDYVSQTYGTTPGLVDITEFCDELLDYLDESTEPTTNYDFDIEVPNHYQDIGGTIIVNVQEFSKRVGDMADTLTVEIQAMSSIANSVLDEAETTAQDFLNRITTRMPEMSESINNFVSDLYDELSNKAHNINDKLNNVIQYFGISKSYAEDTVEDYGTTSCRYQDYTGVNPTQAYFSSLPFPPIIQWAAAYADFCIKLMYKPLEWIWNGVKSLVSWFIKDAHEKFIDPTDCETSANTYGFFKEYSSIDFYAGKYMYDNGDQLPLFSANGMMQLAKNFLNSNGSIAPVWFSMPGLAWQCKYYDDDGGRRHVVINRYIKPLDSYKVLELLENIWAQYRSDADISLEYEGFDRFMYALSSEELEISKDAGEKEVALGVITTLAIEQMLSGLFDFYGAETIGTNISNIRSDLLNYFNGNAAQYSLGATDVLFGTLRYLYGRSLLYQDGVNQDVVLRPEFWGQTTYSSGYSPLPDGSNVVNPLLDPVKQSSYDEPTITNKTFITLLSMISWSYGYSLNIADPFKTFDPSLPDTYNKLQLPDDEIPWGPSALPLKLMAIAGCTKGPVQLVNRLTGYIGDQPTYEYINFDISDEADRVYLAYSRDKLDIKLTSSVKTDAQNMAAVRRWFMVANVIIATAIIAVAVGTTIVKLRRTRNVLNAQIRTEQLRAARLLAIEKPSDADKVDLYETYVALSGLTCKESIVNAMLGHAGKSTSSILTNQLSSNDLLKGLNFNNNNGEIIKLIAG